LDTDSSNWITILKGGLGSHCGERDVVKFGENIASSCHFLATPDEILTRCEELREVILYQLLGPSISDGVDLRVASFGDSSIYKPVEWVPFLKTEEVLPGSYKGKLDILINTYAKPYIKTEPNSYYLYSWQQKVYLPKKEDVTT